MARPANSFVSPPVPGALKACSAPRPAGAGPSIALRSTPSPAPDCVEAGSTGANWSKIHRRRAISHDVWRLQKEGQPMPSTPDEQKEILSYRSVKSWVKALQKIRQPHVRAQCGCIVWWDWVAPRLSNEDRREILRYMREWDTQVAAQKPFTVRPKSIYKGLLLLGYPETVAKTRSEV